MVTLLWAIVAGVFIGIVIGHWQAWPYIKKLRRHRHELHVALRCARAMIECVAELQSIDAVLQDTCPLCDGTGKITATVKCQCCPPEAL